MRPRGVELISTRQLGGLGQRNTARTDPSLELALPARISASRLQPAPHAAPRRDHRRSRPAAGALDEPRLLPHLELVQAPPVDPARRCCLPPSCRPRSRRCCRLLRSAPAHGTCRPTGRRSPCEEPSRSHRRPHGAMPRMSAARSSARHRRGTYTAGIPRARKAALCMIGERECETGSPRMTRTRELPLITARCRPPG